jgi:hypothetical protein
MSRESSKSTPRRAISELDAKANRYEVSFVDALEIQPSPENAEIYGAIDFNTDPALSGLRRSISKRGLEEPLILTTDKVILSGHRRYYICVAIGIGKIPCRFVKFKRSEIKDIHRVLAEYNPQRVKSAASILAENFLVDKKQESQTQSWGEYQEKASSSFFTPLTVAGSKNVGEIGERQQEFLAAAKKVTFDLEAYWPLTPRKIHYGLLNNPPLTQVTTDRNERWRYRNDVVSYSKLSRLLTAARYSGDVPWRAIADMTRETRECAGYSNLTDFIESESRRFLTGYGRHRQEGQAHQIEVILEKNTLICLVQDICEKFHLNFTPLRGYGGPSVWHELHMRWLKKMKQNPDAQLILIFVTDHDPEGLDLMDDAVRSLRDNHSVPVQAIRAAVTMEQVKRFKLPSNPAKESSARFANYVKRTGTNRTWECEALEAEDLRHALHEAILSAVNVEQLQAVEKLEAAEQVQLERIRQRIAPALKKVLLGGLV